METLCSAIDDESMAIEIIRQLKLPVTDVDAESVVQSLATQLYVWVSKIQPRLVREYRRKSAWHIGHCNLEVVVPNDITAVYDSLMSTSLPLVRSACKSKLSQLLKGQESQAGKEMVEEAERRRWAAELSSWLKEAQLPVMSIIEATMEPAEAWLRVFGARRAKTLRNRAKTWKKIRNWILNIYAVPFPTQVSYMLDYLSAEMEASPFRSTPGQIAAALSVMEQAGQIPVDTRISESAVWKATVSQWQSAAATGNTTIKRAEIYCISLLLALELTVMDFQNNICVRVVAWTMLTMHWACLRVDDLQGVDRSRLSVTASGLKGVLTRTKTTGPGRSVLEVPFFVDASSSLTGSPWLRLGFQLWMSEPLNFSRTYFLMKMSLEQGSIHHKPATCADFNMYMRLVLRQLKVPARTNSLINSPWKLTDEELVPFPLERFWSGHSPRHWAPSVSAVLGVHKDERDFLGRWQVNRHASNDYVLTSQQVVRSIQRQVSQAIITKSNYDEEDLLQRISRFAASHGLDGERVKENLSVLIKSASGEWGLLMDPVIGEAPDSQEPVSIVSQTSDTDTQMQEAPYWVSVSVRTGFKRLHKMYGCGTHPWNCSKVIEVHQLKADTADAICKDCLRKFPSLGNQTEEDSSTSGSSSSEESVEPDPNEIIQPQAEVALVSDDSEAQLSQAEDSAACESNWSVASLLEPSS